MPQIGRKAGSKNVASATAKENIQAVFTRLGSTAAMASWAEDNLTEFYRIYARLLPTETKMALTDEEGGPLLCTVKFITAASS